MINTSDILNKIGARIAADDTLANICASTFGRGCQVAVSGYAQKLMGEDDAPFVMVFPDEDEMDVNEKEVKNFIAKVVIGFCPVKDIPNAETLVKIASFIGGNLASAIDAASAFIDEYAEGQEKYERANELLEHVKTAKVDRIDGLLDSINDLYKSGDLEAVIVKVEEMRIAIFDSTDVIQALAAIHNLLRPDAQISDDTTFGAALVAMNEAQTSLVAEEGSIRAKWDDFNENPFIADTRSVRNERSNGLIVFGSLNILDSFRNCLNRILNENDFGLPVMKVTMKNTSSSHYPLEWAVMYVEYNEPEALT